MEESTTSVESINIAVEESGNITEEKHDEPAAAEEQVNKRYFSSYH